MRPAMVVPVHPVPNDPPRLFEGLELMLPDTLLLETAKEPFNQPVLLRGIGRDEFLRQPIVPAGSSEPPALKDQPVIAPDRRRRACRPQGPKARQTGRLHCPLGLLRPSPQGEFIPDELAIMTVNHRRQMPPAVLSTGNVRQIHRPAGIAAWGAAHPAPDSRAGCARPLVHEPLLQLQHPIDRLTIDRTALPEAQEGPDPAIAEGGMLLDESLHLGRQGGAQRRPHPRSPWLSMQRRPRHLQDLTRPPFRDARHDLSYSSDVPRAKG